MPPFGTAFKSSIILIPSLYISACDAVASAEAIIWTDSAPIGSIFASAQIEVDSPTEHLLSAEEQKVMKTALLRSVTIVSEGA